MPKTIKNEETGTEETVYTAEELEAQKDEAIENYKKDNPDKAAEVEKLQADLQKATEDLAKEKEKDKNFGNLRGIKEDLEKKLNDLTGSVPALVDQGIQKQHTEGEIKKLADGDVELEKKIRLHFETTLKAVTPKNQEEVNKKIQDAYLLATGTQASGVTSTVLGSGGASFVRSRPANTQPLSEGAKTVGNKLGLSDKDLKDYDKQDFSNTP